MAFEKCTKCGGLHWSTDACKESTGQLGVRANHVLVTTASVEVAASSVHLPAQAAKPLERIISKANGPDDTQEPVRSNPDYVRHGEWPDGQPKFVHVNAVDPPKPVNSRTAYFRQYMRDYRARLKAARNSVNITAKANG